MLFDTLSPTGQKIFLYGTLTLIVGLACMLGAALFA